MYLLGINAYHGDASAVLLKDGQLVAAVEEERFRRIKHWAGFPSESIRTVLRMGGIDGSAIEHVAVSKNPRKHLLRKLAYVVRARPSMATLRDRARNATRLVGLEGRISETLGKPATRRTLHHVEHHPSHLASSFFVGPFEDAACCAVDGFGDFVSTSWARGSGNRLDVLDRVYYPHSLGLMYTAVTQYLGFMGYGDEFKVMGLAPYGKPEFVKEVRRLVKLLPGGGGKFELDLRYFRHATDGIVMEWADGYPSLGRVFSDAFEPLLGPARAPDAALGEREENIASSLQAVYEECLVHVLDGLWERTHNPRLCLAGGCAMNSVANGKIRERTRFTDVYIQPASADNGTSLGAAYYVWHHVLGNPRTFRMEHGYWGPEHDETQAVRSLHQHQDPNWTYTVEKYESSAEVAKATACSVAEGAVVGWYQGGMEWGARALGNRSIVADPRRADMRDLINTKIKFRERFRPFAPSIAEEAIDHYFVGAVPDPFMLQVYPIREEKRSIIPAVTHVDGSGRLQTVSRRTNETYYALIKEFEKLTGLPIVLNTSFNENEPIVDTPSQALDCFLRTKMDVIVLNNTIIRRRPK